jgi:hypothetical protein
MISAPDGWSVNRSSSKASEIANCNTSFRNGAGRVEVEIIDPMTQVQNVMLTQGDPAAFTNDPVGSIHKVTKWRGTIFVPSKYKEDPEQSTFSNYGRVDYSEFTGNGGIFGFGGPMHGYRATMPGGKYIISVVTMCPEGSWKDCQSAFMRIIQSVGPADGSKWHPEPDFNSPSNSGSNGADTGTGDNSYGSGNGNGYGSGYDNSSKAPSFNNDHGVTTISTPDPNAGKYPTGVGGDGY